MKYPILERNEAVQILDARRHNIDLDEDRFVGTRGDGADFDGAFIQKLREKLEKIKSRYPAKLRSSRDQEGGRFEADACSVVHATIPSHVLTALSDVDFWRYLAVVHFHSLVEWRHGSEGAETTPANYGIGNTKRNLLYRMWMRAEVSLDVGTPDPYHLAKYGNKDLWDSHIIPVRTGNARSLVRSLLKFLYPAKLKGKCCLSGDNVRALAKNLTRLRANVFLELYDEERAYRLIGRETDKVCAAAVAKSAD
jgi:hypothetical protein